MTGGRLLLVEDRESLARMLTQALAGEGYQVVWAADCPSALARVAEGGFDLVLSDLKLPGGSGLEVVAACRGARPPLPVVVMTAYGTVESAVAAMKRGAVDFLEKPVGLDDLFRLVASVLGRTAPATPAWSVPGGPTIVGTHPLLRRALHLLEKVAPLDATVLLTGESGTGKELFAAALHALSPRRRGPMVALNCAAIPESLLENELFGHEKGAFTGANERRPGRFELAEGGTLLLDEIGELPLGVQAKVLRVLEQRSYERVGGGSTRKANVRLVAATNRDLGAMVGEGRFRQDLFFRLDVFPITLPALAERPSDIGPLAEHLLSQIARRIGRPAPMLSAEAVSWLEAQPWPGNVRQLGNTLERALILSDGGELSSESFTLLQADASPPSERERLRQALVANQGDKKVVAAELGLPYRTVVRRIRELDLEGVPRYRPG